MRRLANQAWSDILGIGSAALCLVHCLVLPFLLTAPLLGSYGGFVHVVFVLISGLGVWATIRNSKRSWLKYSLIVFFLALVVGSFFEHSSTAMAVVFRVGVAGLILTHVVNLYLTHADSKELAIS